MKYSRVITPSRAPLEWKVFGRLAGPKVILEIREEGHGTWSRKLAVDAELLVAVRQHVAPRPGQSPDRLLKLMSRFPTLIVVHPIVVRLEVVREREEVVKARRDRSLPESLCDLAWDTNDDQSALRRPGDGSPAGKLFRLCERHVPRVIDENVPKFCYLSRGVLLGVVLLGAVLLAR